MSDQQAHVSILYGGKDAFAPQPTPIISVEESAIYYGELWGQTETFTLQGQITGCTFDALVSGQRAVLDTFSKSFQPLELWQSTGTVSGLVFRKSLSEVTAISFENSRWLGIQPYTVSLRCYPTGLFSGAFGVLNPVDTWSYDEKSNLSLDAVHTVSAQGFNTSSAASNALDNARQWVWGRTGTASTVPATFIANVNPGTFCLLTVNEDINRLNGTYSITERYTNDLTRNLYGVLRYSTSISSGNNLLTVSLNGQIEGCGRDIVQARAMFTRLDKLGTATFSYSGLYPGLTDLNPTPVTQSVTEDAFNAVVAFSYTFNNDNSPPVYFDYDVSLESGQNITASIQGRVIARTGDLVSRFAQAQQYAATQNLYNLVVPFYQTFYPYASQFPLNPIPVTSGMSLSPSDGTVALNASFNNDTQISPLIDQFEYSIQFQPAVEHIDIKPVVTTLFNPANGVYSLVDLGFKNRASLSIDGNVLINEQAAVADGVATLKQAVFALFGQYGRLGNAVLDRQEITSARDDTRKLSFGFTWSFDSPNLTALAPYSLVNTLSV